MSCKVGALLERAARARAPWLTARRADPLRSTPFRAFSPDALPAVLPARALQLQQNCKNSLAMYLGVACAHLSKKRRLRCPPLRARRFTGDARSRRRPPPRPSPGNSRVSSFVDRGILTTQTGNPVQGDHRSDFVPDQARNLRGLYEQTSTGANSVCGGRLCLPVL
jgi:hypothetical protein